jgi:hypothetical protein
MDRYASTDRPYRRRFFRNDADTAPGPGTEGAWTLARVIDLAVTIVVAILVAGIALVLLGANPANDLVQAVTDASRWLAGPFRNIFNLDNRKTEIAVNWGIAAVVYAFVGHLIANTLRRMTSPAPAA